MNIFGKIKGAIFGRRSADAGPPPEIPAGWAGGPPAVSNVGVAPPSTEAEVQVDVEQVLTELSASKGNPDLNWRTSIVDLMKLLGLDSSPDNRKELATELGDSGATNGSVEMNIWLHRAVMRELATNGGKVPASMTD